MQLVWIATGEQHLRYTFECAECDIELEISDVLSDAQPSSVQSTH